MAYKQKRKVIKLGAISRGIVLPKGWLDFYEFAQGSYVTLLGNSILVVCHPKDEKKARRILALSSSQSSRGKN
jgi:hypothetical protein